MADNKPASVDTITNGHTSHAAAPEPEYDLLPKLLPHLDRHLIYPVLEFMEGQDDQDPMEIKKMKFSLLKETNMTDFVSELDMEIKGSSEAAQEYVEKREQVIKRREELEQATAKLSALLENPEVTNNLRSDKVANLNYLKEQHEVTVEEVNHLYDHGQFMYSIGDYGLAADLLFQFRLLVCLNRICRKRDDWVFMLRNSSLQTPTERARPTGVN